MTDSFPCDEPGAVDLRARNEHDGNLVERGNMNKSEKKVAKNGSQKFRFPLFRENLFHGKTFRILICSKAFLYEAQSALPLIKDFHFRVIHFNGMS
ncbi:hypothetical protein BpHYR1_044781 [Brachionus plicatilis]|uniref:Uncharacterized protein n=1 Tax=Brachionus plicatilis TaxID=10195 RepID=A0A3M7R7R2_BRAPC|nr:hypothetical protein BpHYR1_044781 [Brachionus plicatilis]